RPPPSTASSGPTPAAFPRRATPTTTCSSSTTTPRAPGYGSSPARPPRRDRAPPAGGALRGAGDRLSMPADGIATGQYSVAAPRAAQRSGRQGAPQPRPRRDGTRPGGAGLDDDRGGASLPDADRADRARRRARRAPVVRLAAAPPGRPRLGRPRRGRR